MGVVPMRKVHRSVERIDHMLKLLREDLVAGVHEVVNKFTLDVTIWDWNAYSGSNTPNLLMQTLTMFFSPTPQALGICSTPGHMRLSSSPSITCN